MTEPRVVVLGSIIVDVRIAVPALPPRGGDVLGADASSHAGGGFNVAAAVARQGVECLYAAPHGTGPNGDLVRAALASEGVRTALAPRADADSGSCLALIEPDGEASYVTVPGAEAHLRSDDLDSLALQACDLVWISGYDLIYPDSGAALQAWASRGTGRRLVLDPGPLIMDIPADRLETVVAELLVLTLNRREAMLVVGDDLRGAVLLGAVRERLGLRAETMLVLREGAAGCIASGGQLGDRILAVPAPPVIAVDTTGAGDTHTGVLLARLVEGSGVEAALAAANEAAALSVTVPGSATSPLRSAMTR